MSAYSNLLCLVHSDCFNGSPFDWFLQPPRRSQRQKKKRIARSASRARRYPKHLCGSHWTGLGKGPGVVAEPAADDHQGGIEELFTSSATNVQVRAPASTPAIAAMSPARAAAKTSSAVPPRPHSSAMPGPEATSKCTVADTFPQCGDGGNARRLAITIVAPRAPSYPRPS